MQDKRSWATGVAIVLGISGVVGLIVDVPELIKMAIENGPAFLSHPNTWWIASIVVIEAGIIWWIWRSRDDRVPKIETYEKFLGCFKDASQRVRGIAELLVELEAFHIAVMARAPGTVNETYAFHQLELAYPTRIKRALGEEAEEDFISAVRSAKSAGALIACNAAIPPILDLIWQEFEKLSQRESKNTEIQATRPAVEP